ncbi:MAG: peptidoglycan-binding protein [Clostridia bacterium]|nr:peptidoglycan-binding protein [Clostridia bacterium]
MKRIAILLAMMMVMGFSAATFGAADTTQILTLGVESEQVTSIQKILATEGYYAGEIDGIFGNGTEEAVKAYQKANGLQVDGVIGKNTLAHLFDVVSEETTSGLAEKIQEVVVTRGNALRSAPIGAYLDWWTEVKDKLIFPDDEIIIQDYETGRFFKVVAIAGTKHMDVEALTAEDARIIRELWGGDYSWDRRPVIAYLKGQAVAASLNGMPHAGRDDLPYQEYVSNRSVGYGYGYNYDKIKGNDFEGVICLHFKNSKLHKSSKVDPQHQAAIRKAAGLE